ncbi:MAG: C45 family autoproteolytic acyltransferase/hydrolase [Chitinophagales bacterium]
MQTLKKVFKFFGYTLALFTLIVIALAVYIHFKTKIEYPVVNEQYYNTLQREKVAENHYRIGNNWLKKNKFGIWEMYLEGTAFERGAIYGKLSEELVQKHEDYFIAQIDKLVPSRTYFHFLRVMIAWFNKDIDQHIPEEYQAEIYGISKSFSNKYDILGEKYLRILNYHAAHDIGHALADYAMVGCTSFSVNNAFSEDSSLLIGRNFDFYMGDNFAKNKLLTIVNPDQGHQFLMYSWAGLAGVVSGMNEKGLSVTLNASKSDLPTESKTPISILAREIVQYASTIEEAVAIAKSRETFVSESLMIGSAIDNKTVIIEKSPINQALYVSETDVVVCSNHYQSKFFQKDSININNIKNSDSQYRKQRVNQLLKQQTPLNISKAVSILRNQKGIDNKDLGMGNPKAVNQLLAHHSIVFKPKQKLVWISTPPYQLGNFIAYNVSAIHSKSDTQNVYIDSLSVAQDTFLATKAYQNFEAYKTTKLKIFDYVNIGIPLSLSTQEIETYITNNPETYVSYLTLGDYFAKKGNCTQAIIYYKTALTKEVASLNETNLIKNKISKCQN